MDSVWWHTWFWIDQPLSICLLVEPYDRAIQPRRSGMAALCTTNAPEASLRHEVVRAKKKELSEYLWHHRTSLFKRQHRDSKAKTIISVTGSFKVGQGSVQPGNMRLVRAGHPGFVRHPAKDFGVRITPVAEQKGLSTEQKEAYRLAADLIHEVDPEYARGEFLVQFAFMNGHSKHYVKKHRDKEDVSYQYALSFGDFSGAKLRVWDKAERRFADFDNRDRIVRFDGRRAHEVVTDGFKGNRFTVIWYKNYDSRLSQPVPIYETPCFVGLDPQDPQPSSTPWQRHIRVPVARVPDTSDEEE